MSLNPSAMSNETDRLEGRVLNLLQEVTMGHDGPDVLSSGQVFDVVATGGAVRVLLDPERIPEGAEEALAETLTPLVESLPGVERVVVKPRPRPVSNCRELPGIRRVVGVHSGKGGVGKSTLAVNLAAALAARGLRTGLLDADVYGPSCPTLLGVGGRAETTDDGRRIRPLERHGVRLMSLGLLLPEGEALIWRGSLVDQGLPQLFTDVDWGELDILLVDLPPGTSDVHLAVARNAPLSGVITVTAPGQVSVDDVRRGLEMFADLMVPCIGLIENMAGISCRHCGQVGDLFGSGGGRALADETGIPLLASLPFVPEVAVQGDAGEPVVISAPDTVAARVFDRLAAGLAERLFREQMQEVEA
ncbi:MAG TPA: hypothetical protein ENI96_01215 [Sedimenticola thiotaurini]|uniref:Iron-sulfur cluster carrier protein n=1 Tax=Sedimenticola thiotaurini TaxID=1543721 RepID=A0A831W9E5_9GAMM|nr:hypothetical protein [Sedimenticola thiotaurini]